MVFEEVTLLNEAGLHARPATLFVQAAKNFKSKITVQKGDKQADAKSILAVISLAVTRGTPVVIRAEGEDEEEALATLVQLINSRFGEGVENV